MAGFVFLVGVATFAALAYWAYRNDGLGRDAGETGLFAMTPADPDRAPPPSRASPAWRRWMVRTRPAEADRSVRGAVSERGAPRRLSSRRRWR